MEKSNVRDLNSVIGDCGRFQGFLTFAVHSCSVMSAFGMMIMAFGMYNPGWTCLDTDQFNISVAIDTKEIQGNGYAISTQSANHLSRSTQPSDDVTITKPAPSNSKWSVDCSVKKECKNLLYNDESFTVVSEWDLSCDLAWVPSLLITIEMIGVLVGAYLSGQMGDKLGRKATLYGHLGFLTILHIIAVFSVSWQMYAILLFGVGIGVGGILACSFYYPLEFVTGWWRGVISALPVWNIGCTLFSLVVFILRDWRHVHIAATVLNAAALLGVFWTPDSIRWLTVTGKIDKAKNAVAKIARLNRRPCPDTQVIDDLAEEERTRGKGRTYTYLDLFRLRKIRSYTIKFSLIWFSMAITYYVISFGIKSLSGDFYLNFLIFSIFELPGMLFVAPSVNKLGRRTAGLVYFMAEVLCAMGLVIACFTATGSVKDTCILVLALTCKMIIVGVWAIVCVLSSELYPTVIRGLHNGFLNAISRLGAMSSPYIIPNDPDNIYLAFVIIGGLNIINFGLIWSLPESKGKPLSDVAHDQTVEAEPMNRPEDNEKPGIV